jgi:uncharacterized protein YfdQ (DUF2303 family)
MEASKQPEIKSSTSEAQVGYDLAMKMAVLQQAIGNSSIVEAIPYLLTLDGIKIQTIEHTFPSPMSRRANIMVTSVKSFIELVNRDYEEGHSVIFALLPSNDAGNITAIIDFHGEDNSPSWCEYRIILKLSYTTEWLEWKKILNIATRQLDLAEFLEERYIDVHEANGVSGATILETALSLQAKRDVQFSADYRLQNGDTSLQFTETTSARAGQKGEIEIPKEFCLFIPIYEGFEAIPVRVLFRYRIKDGVLTFILKPVNVERLLINIREAIIAHIGEQTELPVYLGDANTVPSRKL